MGFVWGNENLTCSTKGNEYYSCLLWLTMCPNTLRHFHCVHQMEALERGSFWRRRILVLVFLTPYRDWQGCVLHFLTWGSGRVTRWQSLSFTSVMVLLMIRVQDTMVLLSPGSQIKRNSEQNHLHSSTKTQKLELPAPSTRCTLPPLQEILLSTSAWPCTGMFWVGIFSEKLQIFPQ